MTHAKYHKIQTVFKRDPDNNFKTLLHGDYSLPEFLYLAENEWVFTEKVDGTNIRVTIHEGGRIEYGGRTDRAQIPTFLLKELQHIFEGQDMSEYEGLTLYGEGYGPRIQKVGKLYRDDPSFVLFDVAYGDTFLRRGDIEDIAQKTGIDVVPVIGTGTLADMVEVARAGITSLWGNFQAEGIVARPMAELRSRDGHRIITKIKTRDFA